MRILMQELVCVWCVSELQGTELLVHGQDVWVQLGCEQQVLQGPHVGLDGHVVLMTGETTDQYSTRVS